MIPDLKIFLEGKIPIAYPQRVAEDRELKAHTLEAVFPHSL